MQTADWDSFFYRNAIFLIAVLGSISIGGASEKRPIGFTSWLH
jgi:hypothetical protein